MGTSQRIRTEIGINKTINVELEQDFNFIEILSLKIQQEEIYTKSCSNYGVVIGRITANNGLGIPNAKLSIFIPISDVDKFNPNITAIYPYTTPEDKNEDGYRYNLLPYEASYSNHVPTGTFPSRLDATIDSTAIEIYDKYYKYTVKTNDSGDYMIMGVPLGVHIVFMDLDLSDMGEFSLSPQDLIRMGRATEKQVSGPQFKSSSDLNSLPQILSLSKSIDVSPLWGDPNICQIAINRVDFDLRDDANIDIQPTAVFMGSMFSTPDKFRVRKNNKPKDNMGNLCNLQTGPGQILAIRQTIYQDTYGKPILEQYQLDQSGNVIDASGTWLIELPMNLDYVTINEFGEKIYSNDPSVGIPTKGKYRFKIKWTQPPSLTQQVRRPYYLVPNIREYGWSSINLQNNTDPYIVSSTTPSQKERLAGTYYFGLDWSGYTNADAAVNCEDTFYEFDLNRVYTVSSFIDEFKSGGRARFIGIKEIDDDSCSAGVNKFPVNDGFKNFDFLYFLFAIIFQVIQLIGVPVLIIFHFLAFLWNNFAVILLSVLIYYFAKNAVQEFALAVAMAVAATGSFGATLVAIAPFIIKGILNTFIALGLASKFKKIVKYRFGRIKLPMITYPDCQACECEPDETAPGGDSPGEDTTPNPGLLSQLSNSSLYIDGLQLYEENVRPWQFDLNVPVNERESYYSIAATMKSIALAGNGGNTTNPNSFKINSSHNQPFQYPGGGVTAQFAVGLVLPPGERINIFNTRKKYFDGENKIRVTFDLNSNIGRKHYDNTITVLSTQDLAPGTLLSFVNTTNSKDPNYLWSGTTTGGTQINGIEGTSITGATTIQVNYAATQTSNSNVSYYISSGTTETRAKYPGDIEYYQVITAITITTALVNGQTQYTNPNFNGSTGFWGALNAPNIITVADEYRPGWVEIRGTETLPTSYFQDFVQQKVLILQRGVDPYSPKVINQYGIGKILGYPNEDDIVITATTRLNIPIQALPTTNTISVQNHRTTPTNNQIFFYSNFFTPGRVGGQQFSAYTTDNVGYYGALDSNNATNLQQGQGLNFPVSGSILGRRSNPSPPLITSTLGTSPQRNRYYSVGTGTNSYYTSAEDVSGGALMSGDRFSGLEGTASITCPNYGQVHVGNICYYDYKGTPFGVYYSPNLYPQFTGTSGSHVYQPYSIMRTDRLPSSDTSDNRNGFTENVSLLQQNLGFAVYSLDTAEGFSVTSGAYSTGAELVTADIEGQYAEQNVISTMSTCVSMVSLNCYSGNGYSFGVKDGCEDSDAIVGGCYILMKKPLLDLGKDLKSFSEWGFRFRFFYALCRGVLSQSFVNNWVNGTLYSFPIQVDTYFNSQNNPLPPIFAKKLVYFDEKTNNFYYRSSPYYSASTTTQKFIGRPTIDNTNSLNSRNLLFPTTIINLGMKASFYNEIMFDPSAKAYIMKTLDATSYSDTSDLVNLFVISRITDETFLTQLFAVNNNNNINQLFSRGNINLLNNARRIDGDLAQSMSINSEYGVIPFSPEFYSVNGTSSDPVVVIGSLNSPTMGIFFSSTTEDLQNKDFITPGVIDFRVPNNANAVTYFYGIKTQVVPFYQWGLSNQSTIFGNQYNEWETGSSNIFSSGYQSLNRRNTVSPSYFIGSNAVLGDIYARGYIFNVDTNGMYSTTGGTYPNKFAVGAPNHFYFGLVKGDSALDKFKTKYSINE